MRAAAVAMVVFLAVGMTPVSSNLICHYCGVDDNCPQPYFFNEGVEPKVIECPQSCMKFDGVAEDGFRVTVRYSKNKQTFSANN